MSSVEDRVAALEQAVFGSGSAPDYTLHAIRETYRFTRLRLHILRYLLANPYATQQALVALSEDVVGSRTENPLASVRSNITQLRRVIEQDDIYIETLRGIGWRMSPASKAKLKEACGLLRSPRKPRIVEVI